MIIPSTAARYEMASHQAFTMPQPLANAVPEFPADYRPASSAPVTVCAAVAVGGDGTVSSVGLVHAAGCVDPAVAPAALEASVRSAVSAWRFTPAMFCTYPDAATRDRDWTGHGCAGAVQEARAVPVSLAWAFTFELRDGQPRVSGRRAGR